jgi:hypothetical protein
LAKSLCGNADQHVEALERLGIEGTAQHRGGGEARYFAETLSAQFEVEAVDAATDVAAFLAVLDAEQVLVPAPGVE